MESEMSSPVRPKQTPNKGLSNIEMMCSPIPRTKTPVSKKLGHPLMMSSPSPAHKMPGSGTRNELYLKSVLSPYHKNYTPLSATPAGMNPMYRTPGKNACPVMKETPLRQPKNPFEFDVEHLEGHMFMSPGVFSAAGSTPATDEKKAFRWSIEHIAVLNPADIDEMPHQQDAHHGHDTETEEKAQRAIDTYFQNNLIVPSPAPGSHTTPAAGQRLGCLHEELQGSIQKQLPGTSKGKKEASCQTMLSLPMDFDVYKVLGQYMQTEQNTEENQEMLSTSSLRRKLFFQGDNSGIALSPVKSCPEREGMYGQTASSPLAKTPQKTEATPLKTPSRSQFSSSPIKNVKDLHTPLYKRTPGEDFLDNLDFSPIVHGHISRVRSSGLFNPHDGSFVEDECSPVREEHLAKPLVSPEISPIKPAVLLKTPSISSKNLTCPGVSPIAVKTPSTSSKNLDSPGFSPIAVKTPSTSSKNLDSPGFSPIALASPVMSPAYDGSFIEYQTARLHEDSDEDMKTPQPAEVNDEKLKKAESCRKISTLGRHRHKQSLSNFDDTAMDFEPVAVHKNLRFADVDDIKTSSLLFNRETSFAEMEFTNENVVQPNSTSHDTGYQTTSLQLTSQDTASGSSSNLTNHFPVNSTGISTFDGAHQRQSTFQDMQHTNLTAQFGSLPTNSFYYDGDSVLDCNEHQTSPCPKEHLVHHILDITNPEKFGHGPYSEEEILERARRVLQLANEMFPESNTGSEQREMQDICDKTGLSTLYELEPIVSPEKRTCLPSASDQAMEILRRAGEDLAKFGHLLSSIKSSAEKSILQL